MQWLVTVFFYLDKQCQKLNLCYIKREDEKMIEEKPNTIIKAIKQRIKYLEANDPHNETLEVLRDHVLEQEWRILPA